MLQGASHHVGESTWLGRATATPASPLHSSQSRARAWLAAVAGHARPLARRTAAPVSQLSLTQKTWSFWSGQRQDRLSLVLRAISL